MHVRANTYKIRDGMKSSSLADEHAWRGGSLTQAWNYPFQNLYGWLLQCSESMSVFLSGERGAFLLMNAKQTSGTPATRSAARFRDVQSARFAKLPIAQNIIAAEI